MRKTSDYGLPVSVHGRDRLAFVDVWNFVLHGWGLGKWLSREKQNNLPYRREWKRRSRGGSHEGKNGKVLNKHVDGEDQVWQCSGV